MRTAPTVVLSLLLLLLSAGAALSDGGFFWREGADLMEPEQLALIHYDGRSETLILRVKYEGKADEFAWVVPVPSVPEVDALEQSDDSSGSWSSLFDELSRYARDREKREIRHKPMTGGFFAMETAASRVEVIERKRVGVYDVAVLRGDDARALTDWLNGNGFVFPPGRGDVLDHYVRKGWFFVASRIAPEELTKRTSRAMHSGKLQPIRFRFASGQVVYPLKMSSINRGTTEVLIYVLSEVPVVPGSGPRADEISLRHSLCNYRQLGAGVVDPQYGTYARADSADLPMTWRATGEDGESAFLCKYRIVYDSAEMTDDLTFKEFAPVRYWAGVRDTASSIGSVAMASWVLAWHRPMMLLELTAAAETELRCAAAYSRNVSIGVLRCLAPDPEYDVRRMVALNKATPADLLRTLARDQHYLVRQAVAAHDRTPVDALELLASDRESTIRTRVGSHPSAGESIWRLWTESPEERLRLTAAGHKNASVDVLERLVEDESHRVRESIARRRDLPFDVVRVLARDPSARVRQRVVWACGEGDADLLTVLARDSESSVRERVAGFHFTPPDVLVELSGDESAGVRKRAARNSSTPEWCMLRLAHDVDEDVRRAARSGLWSYIRDWKKIDELIAAPWDGDD